MEICAETLDDLLRVVFKQILRDDLEYIATRRGKVKEILGVILKLKNPRARISHSEQRGYIASPLGEFFWYLSGSDRADFITYYIPQYKEEKEQDGSIYGAYGPRIFGQTGSTSQLDNVLNLLGKRKTSRQAVIQLFDKHDLNHSAPPKNIPCTCTLQFMLRSGKLEMFAHMRSNDAYLGLSHDVFAFTMLQEIIANKLGVDLGTYHHLVNNLHMYERHEEHVSTFIAEGLQTTIPMPQMPGNTCKSLQQMLRIEETIRTNGTLHINCLDMDDYWKDLARLLQIHQIKKQGQGSIKTNIIEKKIIAIGELRDQMECRVYDQYIRAILVKLEQKKAQSPI